MLNVREDESATRSGVVRVLGRDAYTLAPRGCVTQKSGVVDTNDGLAGRCGDISLRLSSGFTDILDEAALCDELDEDVED